MKVRYIGVGVLSNEDGMLHFTQDDNENLICMETGEIMNVIRRDENDKIAEIDFATSVGCI